MRHPIASHTISEAIALRMGYADQKHFLTDLGLLSHVVSSVDMVLKELVNVVSPAVALTLELYRSLTIPITMWVSCRSSFLWCFFKIDTRHFSDALEDPPEGYVNTALPRVSDDELCSGARGRNTTYLGSLRRKRAKWEESNGKIPPPPSPSRLNNLAGYNRFSDVILRLAIIGDNIVNILGNDVGYRRYNLPSAESSVCTYPLHCPECPSNIP